MTTSILHHPASRLAMAAGTTPEQFAAFFKSEMAKWQRVAKAAGVYQSR
jgi:tripartite-type tricarboxylate transporter receptor subunit TctC